MECIHSRMHYVMANVNIYILICIIWSPVWIYTFNIGLSYTLCDYIHSTVHYLIPRVIIYILFCTILCLVWIYIYIRESHLPHLMPSVNIYTLLCHILYQVWLYTFSCALYAIWIYTYASADVQCDYMHSRMHYLLPYMNIYIPLCLILYPVWIDF